MGQAMNERHTEKAALGQASYARTEERINLADLVTEMRPIKHPYKAGLTAQGGVEC